MQILSAIFANFKPSLIIMSDSVATTSALTGPSVILVISVKISKKSPFSLEINDGFVVTPSSKPEFDNYLISAIFAVSIKNCIL